MNRERILELLRSEDDADVAGLWEQADEVRRAHVGDAVHLRGLVEVSNYCVRRCTYCGVRAGRKVARYRMSVDEVLDCTRQIQELGYGTLVLQGGEDPGLTSDDVTEIIRRVRDETSLAVTLSLGEREPEELERWRSAGADRFLLRFETTNAALYDRIHPQRKGGPKDRFEVLALLREIGYEVGSGVMVGVPGQTWDDLTNDIVVFRELELDMIGVGPYVPHPETPLGRDPHYAPADQQVPADVETTLRAVALARLVRPTANIPATTALAVIGAEKGRELGLRRGANVVMPNITPRCHRERYEIYPGKLGNAPAAKETHERLVSLLGRIGRHPGLGRGDSPSYADRATPGRRRSDAC